MRNFLKSALYGGLLAARDVLDSFMHFNEVSILCYHSISDAPYDTAVSAADFEAQLRMLQEKGYAFVSLADIEKWMSGEVLLPRKAVALTFDDGYADFETVALPLLESLNAPAALFVVGDSEAARTRLENSIPLLDEAALQRMRENARITVGYHSRAHPDLTKLADADLREEIATPFSVAYLSYPGGKHDVRVHAAARAAGFAGAFSIRPGLVCRTDNRYALPRNVITKGMPLSAVRLRATKAIQWYRLIVQAL